MFCRYIHLCIALSYATFQRKFSQNSPEYFHTIVHQPPPHPLFCSNKFNIDLGPLGPTARTRSCCYELVISFCVPSALQQCQPSPQFLVLSFFVYCVHFPMPIKWQLKTSAQIWATSENVRFLNQHQHSTL